MEDSQPILIRPKVAAQMLSISLAMIYRMMQATEEAARIAKGEKRTADVHEDVRPYLNCGFPMPVRLTANTTRINRSDLLEWLAKKQAG